MAVFVVCSEKGGAGKSSLAQSLSVFLMRKGQQVLLVDADPQRTSAEWAAERREGSLPPISCIEMTGNIRQPLEDIRQRYTTVIVDCGGADSKAMRSALAVADVAIIPFRAKRRDLRVAPAMAEIVETAKTFNEKLLVRSVITQAPTHPNQLYRIDNAKALLRELGMLPLVHFTRNLNAWDDAEESGCSVLEYTEDKKAAEDANSVFCELEEVMGG